MYDTCFAPGVGSPISPTESKQWQDESVSIENDIIRPSDSGDTLVRKTNDYQLTYFTEYFWEEISKLMEQAQWWPMSMSAKKQEMIQRMIVSVFLETHGPCQWARSIFKEYQEKNRALTRSEFQKEMNKKMKNYQIALN